MTGWLIKVPTRRMGGGRDMDDLYAVGASDPVDALSLLEAAIILTADQQAETVASLPSATMLGLGVDAGQVRLVITQA